MAHFINYGTIDSSFWISNGAPGMDTFTNYGVLKGGISNEVSNTMIINNLGSMGWWDSKGNINTGSNAKVLIQNYAIMLNENAMEFNKFSGSGDKNSHLVISGSGVTFKDTNSKIILGFGEKFQEGKGYLISKLATDTSGTTYNDLGVDFSHLIPKSDIYTLYKQGDYFIARLQPQHSAISNISKTNIRTMNNFMTMSNSMIYPRKNISSLRASERERGNPQDLRATRSNHPPIKKSLDSALDSANPLKSYESFSYRNESINRRIQRQNKRNYNRKSQNLKETQRNLQNLNVDSANKTNQTNPSLRDSAKQNNPSLRASEYERGNPNNLLRDSANHDYYFILTPFFNHNSFAKSGNYNLFGFDYGFLTAFSARVAESNNTISSLGAHFIFSYGSLGDSKDKDLSIKSLNLNLGINYKLDLIYDMYLKARGDFYYFSNALDSATIKNIKPNNLGFGLSVSLSLIHI